MRRLGHAAAPMALALSAGGLAACKAHEASSGTRAPAIDSIDSAERALADNARRLADAGVPLPTGELAEPGVREEAEDAAAAEPDAGGDRDADEGADEGEVAGEGEGQAGVQPTPVTTPTTTVAPDDAPPEPDREYAFSGDEEKSARPRSRRCTRICDLAEASCDLAEQICDLAQRHEDEPRYQAACARAEAQCEAASAACDRCED